MSSWTERVYENKGNTDLLLMIPKEARRILDIGCGCGDNARLVKQTRDRSQVFGVTRSAQEREKGRQYMQQCWVADIETSDPRYLADLRFDCLLFCHVLEHLRDPVSVIRSFLPFLELGGCLLIAVPNVLFWQYRMRFLAGRFEYEEGGTMDDGHLRFFTYRTVDRYLTEPLAGDLLVVDKTVTGAVPLWVLRRHVLPSGWAARIDRFGCKSLPNLFGSQVMLKCIRQR